MRARGFTLLEMVVVLVVLGLATAMAAPAGYRMIRSWQDADAVRAALQQIAALPIAARDAGAPLEIPGRDPRAMARHLNLPEGWSATLDAPLSIRANGSCSASSGRLETGHQSIRFLVGAPFCHIEQLPADAP